MKPPEPGEARTESESHRQACHFPETCCEQGGWEVGHLLNLWVQVSTNHIGYAQVAVWVTLFGICGDPQDDPVPIHGTGDSQDYNAQWASIMNLAVPL